MRRLLTILGCAVGVGAVMIFINLSYVGAGDPGALAWQSADKSSLAGLNDYRGRINQKIDRIVAASAGLSSKKVRATVTFSRPLSIDERDALVKDFAVDVQAFEARAIDIDKLRDTSVTIEQLKNDYMNLIKDLGPKIPGGIITFMISPQYTMKEIDEHLSTNSYNEVLMGFTNMRALIPAKNLKALNNDPRVFLADVTLDESIAVNPKGKWMPNFFWDLESLGYQGR